MPVSLNRFVVTQAYTIPAGTATAVSNGFGTVSWAGSSGAYAQGVNGGSVDDAYASQTTVTLVPGQVIMLDSGTPGALYSLLNTAGVLRPYVQGQDDVGHAALSN